ncbi:hypothetical protein HPB49_001648 [Dermacentor silvarum]|uniref:Uncharacterized protein n=1 Tax=Dermacentor silvarum TaxID=543639 RepID=A0ACB8C6R3_DERSI|nr:hypothetical protein HPB49_001648 [Dermacentor silvarum]
MRHSNLWHSNFECRTIEIRGHGHRSKAYSKSVGVPQGGRISPVLLNLAMHGLSVQLRKKSGGHCTMYTNDITVWMEPSGTLHTTAVQCQTIKQDLGIIAAYLVINVMATSSEKCCTFSREERHRNVKVCAYYRLVLGSNELPTESSKSSAFHFENGAAQLHRSRPFNQSGASCST